MFIVGERRRCGLGPGLLIAPCLEIGLAASGKIFSPCRFKRRPRSLEIGGPSISLLARIEAAVPFQRLGGIRDARSLDDQSDADAGIVDVPGERTNVDAFAGKDEHAPMKRGQACESNCPIRKAISGLSYLDGWPFFEATSSSGGRVVVSGP
jgi:hypothetical protein